MRLHLKFLFLVSTSPIALANDTIEVIGFRATDSTPISFENILINERYLFNTNTEPSFFLSHALGITNYSDSGSFQGYSYIRMRGIDQTRINMSLDGVPLNEPEDQGVYFSNYSGVFGALASAQIQRGVGTSQNGTASFGGSIQLKSRDLNAAATTIVEAGLASFNTRSVSARYTSGVSNGRGYFVQLSHVDSDGYKHHSGNKSDSIFINSVFEDELGYWKVTGFSGEQENELAWLGVKQQDIVQDPRTNRNAGENDHFRQSLLYLTRFTEINDDLTSDIKIYGNTLRGNYDFDLNNFLGLPSTNEMFNYGFDSWFQGLIATINYQYEHFNIVSGIHVNDYEREHTGSEKALGRLYSNTGFKNSRDAFLAFTYKLNAVTFFADVQHRKTEFRYSGSVPIKKLGWDFTNPRIGVSYQAADGLTAYYGVGKTSREPTRTDVFGGSENLERDENGMPLLFVVRSERVLDHELGLRFSRDRFSGSGNIYLMRFANEITLNGQYGPNGLPLNQTVDSSFRSGLELSANYLLTENIEIKAIASVSKNEIKEGGATFEPVLTPKKVGEVSFGYDLGALRSGASIRYQGESYLNLANTERVDSYHVVGLYTAWSIKGLEALIQINNLLDERYNNSGSMDIYGEPNYFVAAPRNVALTVRVSL